VSVEQFTGPGNVYNTSEEGRSSVQATATYFTVCSSASNELRMSTIFKVAFTVKVTDSTHVPNHVLTCRLQQFRSNKVIASQNRVGHFMTLTCDLDLIPLAVKHLQTPAPSAVVSDHVKQGAHLTKPGWSKPHIHSTPN